MTRREAVAALFRSRPHEWIDDVEFIACGGRCAWRTRISDARKAGMVIENRLVRHQWGVRSQYRWVPREAPQQQTLPGVAA